MTEQQQFNLKEKFEIIKNKINDQILISVINQILNDISKNINPINNLNWFKETISEAQYALLMKVIYIGTK